MQSNETVSVSLTKDQWLRFIFSVDEAVDVIQELVLDSEEKRGEYEVLVSDLSDVKQQIFNQLKSELVGTDEADV